MVVALVPGTVARDASADPPLGERAGPGDVSPQPGRSGAGRDVLEPVLHRDRDHAAAARAVHRAHRPELPAPRTARLPGQGARLPTRDRARAGPAGSAPAGRRRPLAPARRPLGPGGPPAPRP